MALPPGLSTVTVSGTYKTPDGSPRAGRIVFSPEPDILTSATHGTLVLGAVEAVLDNNGTFTATLLATDDPDVTPSGWTYAVSERWNDAIGRSYHIALPSGAPTVDLADIAPTAPADGEYVVITGPAGPPGPPGQNGQDGQDGSNADAEAYADAAVTAHVGAADPHGDRAWADGKFATITVVNTLTGAVTTLQGSVTDLDGFVQNALTRVAAIEQGTAFLAALNVAGDAQVTGGNLTVTDFTKGYRFRVDGSALDLEATGTDLIVSNWSGDGFNGTQRSYARLSADALNTQWAGKFEFVDALYGTVRHTLDGANNTAGFFGAAPVSRPTVDGSWADGTAGESLAAALALLGLITDNTTP
jgi:hypothetical protein